MCAGSGLLEGSVWDAGKKPIENPVYPVKDVKIFGNDAGIVLSLYERHHDAVIHMLEKHGRREGIFPVSDAAQAEMRKELLNLERKQVLTRYDFDDNEKIGYENRARILLAKYQRIECRYMNAFRLGAYAIWNYFTYMRNKSRNDVFCLYYPVTHQHHDDEKLRGANGYLLGKLKGEGIECISRDNIDFWQYMYTFYPENVVLVDDYTFADYTENLVECLPNVPVDKKLISLTEAEEHRGKKLGKEMGLDRGYVCISNRDMVFLHTMMRDKMKADFRDPYRNSSIENCCMAADYLGEKNMQVVRMGSMVENAWIHPNVVDYANTGYRDEFMDVYLVAHCKFFVSDLSGIMAFPMLMAKPMIVMNAPLLTTRYDAPVFLSHHRDLSILKKLWDKKHGRYLTLCEMLDYEVNLCRKERNVAGAVLGEYASRGIVPVDNSPEEVLAVVKEMNERIDGTIQYDEIDRELQNRYREIVDNFPMRDNVLNNWRLGASFLRENQWLLDS